MTRFRPACRACRRLTPAEQKKIIRFCSGPSLRVRRRPPCRLRWPHPTPTETVMPHCLAQRAALTAPSPAATRPSSGP
ncbi:hypothetical protein E3D04_17500, partial [Burkholderia cepacia]